MPRLLRHGMLAVSIFAVALLAVGAFHLTDYASTEFELFGQKIKSQSIGLVSIALSAMVFVLMFRRLLSSADKAPSLKEGTVAVASSTNRETLVRLGERVEKAISMLRNPRTTHVQIEQLREDVEAFSTAHSLFMNQELYPLLSVFKDTLQDASSSRSSPKDHQRLQKQLVTLRDQVLQKIATLANEQPPKRVNLVLAVSLTLVPISLLTLWASQDHAQTVVMSASPTPITVEVQMPPTPLADAGPRRPDAGPRTLLKVLAIPRGQIWIDGRVVGSGQVIRPVTPGSHEVSVGGSDSPTVSRTVEVPAGTLRSVELRVRSW